MERLFRYSEDELPRLEKHIAHYVPYIQKAFAAAGQKSFLDIGCGKGDFVELLLKHGVAAGGVDLNKIKIEEGQAKGRNIQLADGLDYLKSLEAETLSGVSMFQVVEHMSFDALFEIAKEIARTVARGGVAMIETINSFCYRRLGNFCLDPSHCVLPSSDAIKLMLELLGFHHVEIMFSAPISSFGIEWEPLQMSYENVCVIGWKN